MSTDYNFVCHTCKEESPLFASGSGFNGFKVWQLSQDMLDWLGHGKAVGNHEGHKVELISEHWDVPEDYKR